MADAGFRLKVEGEKEFKAAIAEINNVIKLNRSELKLLAEQYNISTRPMDELKSRQKALTEAMELQKEKSAQIAAQIEKVSAVYGDNDAQVMKLVESYNASETALAKLQGEYNKTTTAIDQANSAMKELSNAEAAMNADFQRFRDVIQMANDELDNVGNSANNAGQSLGDVGGAFDKSGKSAENSKDRIEKLNTAYAALKKSIDTQKSNIAALTENLKKAEKAYGENSKETAKYREQLEQATQSLNEMTEAAEKNREKVDEINESDGGYTSMLDKVEEIAGQLGIEIPDGLKNVLSGVGNVTTGFGAWVPAIGAAGAALKLVIDSNKKLLETATKYRDMYTDAQVLGVDTTEYQKLQYAMARTGVASSELEGLFSALNGKIKEVDEVVGEYAGNLSALGSASDEEKEKVAEAMAAWDEYGVALYDQNGELRNTIDIFYDIIDVFDDYSNKTERITKLQGLFGESAARLNPAIEAGSDNLRKFAEQAEEAGVVLDDFTMTRMYQLSSAAETQAKKVEVLKDRWNLFIQDLFNVSKWGSGNLSNSASGLWDSITGMFKGYAAGTPYAPEGWAKVGENGPEIVHLPRGAAVYPTGVTPSGFGGGEVNNNTYNITIPADNIKEFNDIIRIVQGASVAYRRG